MIITLSLSNFDINDVYFCKPIKNKVMTSGHFIRIIYSNELVSINGIHLSFILNGKVQEVYSNKFKYTTSFSEESNIIKSIQAIEEHILNNVNVQNKSPQYKLREKLNTGSFKFFQNSLNTNSHYKTVSEKSSYSGNSNIIFILKISGVWVTETSYGITYKFTRV